MKTGKLMMKIAAVLVVTAAMWLIPAQKADAQDLTALGFFQTVSDRDQYILQRFTARPYYMVATGPKLSQAFAPLLNAPMGMAPDLQGASYQRDNQGDMNIIFRSSGGGQAVVLVFFIKKENAQKYLDDTINEGFNAFGVFDAGSTDATRKAALQRILNDIKAYSNDAENPPQTW
jgi:hypothetical protein